MLKENPANAKSMMHPEDGTLATAASRNIDEDLTFTLLQPPPTNGEYLYF
jgi:hypothetical protein